MKNRGLDQLGRRERQIMEIIYRRGRANAAEVLADLPDPPTYTAVRGMLRLLESKGHLRHEQDGPRYVYFPTADHDRVSKSAVRHLVRTFFDNSASSAVAAMVGMYEDRWSDADLDSLEKLIEKARGKGGAHDTVRFGTTHQADYHPLARPRRHRDIAKPESFVPSPHSVRHARQQRSVAVRDVDVAGVERPASAELFLGGAVLGE